MENSRIKTRPVMIGNLQLGGNDKVLIQSMCNIPTSHIEEVSAQINRCAELGADIMRLSCLNIEDAYAFKEIKKRTSIPLVADIHFDYTFALAALESGVDAIRINPGNIGDIKKIEAVVEACRARHVPIRIGVNSGSLDKQFDVYDAHVAAEGLINSAKKHVKILEDLGFYDIVISLKGSNALETLEAYREASKIFPYPLHIGVTEAGPKDVSLIRSTATLAPLLLEGIGSTIRISLSDDPEEEIIACCRLLHDVGLYPEFPTFISCPTCGRTQVNLIPLANALSRYQLEKKINKTVAVMGCIVNGPGEAKHADLGCAGGNGKWVIFKKDQIIATVSDDEILEAMKHQMDLL